MRYDVPVFDPFGDRGDDYYHPDSDSAAHFVQIAFTHRDIARLFGLLNRTSDAYEAKLLTKFAVVELLSLDEHINRLVGLALSGKTGYSISQTDADEVKQLYGKYTQARKASEGFLREIRNKVAAHRDPLDLIAIAKIWDGIDAATVASIIKPVPGLFERLKSLNIYRWTKSEHTEQEPVIAFVAPMAWDGVVVESGDEESPSGTSTN